MSKPAQANMEISITVRGELSSQAGIKILKGGEAIGLVSGKDVIVEGVIKGKILADNEVVVAKGGQVEGEVEAMTLRVEKGAHYQGRCRIGSQRNLVQEKASEPASLPKTQTAVKRWFWQS